MPRIPRRLIQYTNIHTINFYVNPDSLSILNFIYEFLITSIIGSIRGYKTIKGKDEIRKEREGRVGTFGSEIQTLTHSNTSSILSIPYLLTFFFFFYPFRLTAFLPRLYKIC